MMAMKMKMAARLNAVLLLVGCSVITESFLCRSVPLGGGLGLVRANPTSSLKVVSSDVDSSPYYANATVIDARDHRQHKNEKSEEPSLDIVSPSPSRRKPRSSLGIVASCPRRGKRMRKPSLGNATTPSPFALRATFHSPSEPNRRAGAVDPGRPGCVDLPALVSEPSNRVLAGGSKKIWTNDAYYKYLDYYCEGSEPVTGKAGGWEGTGGVVIASPSLEETSPQSAQGKGRVFRRVEIRAAWRECKGKSLQRSAAPIVDLVGLAVPLLFILGFSLTT